MAKKNLTDFNERLETAAKAKQALLEKMRANAPQNTPGFAERQAERIVLSDARDKRKAEAAERKRAEAAQKAEEAAAAALAAQRAAEEELNRKANEALALKAQQKAGRDAKYAARQARRDSRRA